MKRSGGQPQPAAEKKRGVWSLKRSFRELLLLAVVIALAWSCADSRTPSEIRKENADQFMERFTNRDLKPEGPLTLDEALSWALAHNLDLSVMRMEREIEDEKKSGALLGMLPSLTASGEYTHQDPRYAASSVSVQTGRQSLEASYSAPRDQIKGNLALAWSLVDFGVAYLKYRQSGDEAMMSEWKKSRGKQNLALDVTRAYWRSVVAQRAVKGATTVLDRAEDRRKKAREQVKSKTLSETEGLEVEKKLIEMQIKLQNFENELRSAKTQLAGLIGLSPGVDFELVEPDFKAQPEMTDFNFEEIQREALLNRPELYESDFEEKITLDEARVAIVRMFPNINMFAGAYRDENPYLYRNNWYQVGVSAAWNLLSIPKRWQEMRIAQDQGDLVRERRNAQAVGILTQVSLAMIDFQETGERYRLIKDLMGVQEQLLAAAKKGQAEGILDEGKVFETEAETLFTQVRFYSTYADLEVNRARMFNTLGRDVFPRDQAEPKPQFTYSLALSGEKRGREEGAGKSELEYGPAEKSPEFLFSPQVPEDRDVESGELSDEARLALFIQETNARMDKSFCWSARSSDGARRPWAVETESRDRGTSNALLEAMRTEPGVGRLKGAFAENRYASVTELLLGPAFRIPAAMDAYEGGFCPESVLDGASLRNELEEEKSRLLGERSGLLPLEPGNVEPIRAPEF